MERSPLDPDEFEFDTEKMWAKAFGHHRAGYFAGESTVVVDSLRCVWSFRDRSPGKYWRF
jgi:hypothetical protein